MIIRLKRLTVRTQQEIELIEFSPSVTFIHGPIGKGKSTVARLIDYCFGGELERTPAIQQEFVSATLSVDLKDNDCTFERGANDTQAVRVTWSRGADDLGSVNAPLDAGDVPLLEPSVFNLSDLIFHLCDVEPIKVLKRSRDPDSPMIRLSFRDIWWYCYLDQTHLDSSFFRLEDPFRGRKSQDAMRFFTGLHSERLSQLQADLYRTIAEQQGSREAVSQIRGFMSRFGFGSELELVSQIENVDRDLISCRDKKRTLEAERSESIHPTDTLRERIRGLSHAVFDLRDAIYASEETLNEQAALRAEFITAKIKTERAAQSGRVLDGVDYLNCPKCGADVSERPRTEDACRLCGTAEDAIERPSSVHSEVLRHELNDRIDQIADAMARRKQELRRSQRKLMSVEADKKRLDRELEAELQRYDSSFVESVRGVDREMATLEERRRSLVRLQEMPRAISELEEQAGSIQGKIDVMRSSIDAERSRLKAGDANAQAIAGNFKALMLAIRFPGVSEDDEVVLDPRNWKPTIVHEKQEWGFWDTGSGGKKTLFNVCYALAVHEVARERGLPVPNVLVIDSPTKNISDDENPELVQALYREIYRFAMESAGSGTQFVLIDSNLVYPDGELPGFTHRRMAGEPDAPSLISYYDGP